jgi:DNA-directed RNA polymerase specialized sigma24 family protein
MSASQASLGEFRPGWNELTEAEREAYQAVEESGWGVRAWARYTGRSPGTVGNLLQRARTKLGEV